jgi:hypothetical protein
MADHHQQEVNTAKNGTKIRASSSSDDDMVVISHPPAATNTTSVYMKRSHDEKKKAQQQSKSPPLVEQAFARTAVPAPSTTSIPAFTTTPPLLQKSISSEDDDENDFRHAVEVLDPNKSSQDSAQEVLPTSASPRRLQARADRRGKHRPANKKTSTGSIQQTEGATGARTEAPTSTTTTATLQQSKSVDKNGDDDDGDYWSVEDDDDGNDHENQQPAATASTPTPVAGTNNAQNSGGGGGGGRITLSREDIQVCQQLDAEYEQALEEREVGYAARYNSVRQSACFSVAFMLIYLTLGTLFFVRQAAETEAWTVSDSLLFSIYTITTVGCKFLAKKKDLSWIHSTKLFAYCQTHVFDLFFLFSWIFFSSRTLFT